MSTKKRNKLFFLIFTTMFLLGGIQNTKGIILEKVQNDIQLDVSQVGILVSIFQVGFLIASLVAGIIADRKGIKLSMLIGSSAMIIGLLGTSTAFTVLFFLGFYLIVGLGIGAMTVSVATIIPRYFKEKAGVLFNFSNALFGVGMIVTPLILNFIFSHQVSWRFFYIAVSVVIAVVVLVLLSIKEEEEKDVEQKVNISLKSFIALFADRQIILVVLFIVFYVALEAGFLNFFPIFYTSLDITGASAADKATTATYIIASFAFLFTFGRFLGSYIIYKLGEKKTLVFFSLFAVLSIVLGRIFMTDFSYLIMLFGLALSVLFPTAQGIGAKLTKQMGTLQGVIYVASGLGGAVIGVLIGTISKAFGIQNGFNMLIVFSIIILGLAIFIKTPNEKN